MTTMENLVNEAVIEPEDGFSFDAYEFSDNLNPLAKQASDAGEHFPYLWFRGPNGMLYAAKKMRLVKGDQTDGSSNFEIIIDIE
ncbi:hypothetical protein ACI2J5_00150 [Agrobacterium pusense]|uniref:hypothetical protein n=1 Tax=Agrobacterium pusense TaxID=648995 RepID=UPI00384D172C